MNEETLVREKAERIRDVIRYIRRFKNALVIIYIEDTLLDSPLFLSHIKDICLIHEAGLNVIMVPGASKRISEILRNASIPWRFYHGYRITQPEAMPLIKMAAFDVSNQIMTAFAGEKKTAVIGNWVRARGKGVISGFDYGTTGEIDKLHIDSIKTVLANGFIPIFPCIGWSLAGKPYNISSIQLAQQIAVHLKVDKLFYLVPGAAISAEHFIIPPGIGTSAEGNVPAMNLEELDTFLKLNERPESTEQSVSLQKGTAQTVTITVDGDTDACDSRGDRAPMGVNGDSKSDRLSDTTNTTNDHSVVSEQHETEVNVSREITTDARDAHATKAKILTLLHLAKDACRSGVTRVHILNDALDGTIPCEIFSDLGSGTMVYANDYGGIRDMTRDDISAVLNVIKPFVEAGILLPRSKQMLAEQYSHYIVYELDGAIRACAALIPYPDGQMEIAAVAVNKAFSHVGIGPKMISFLVERAKKLGTHSVFLLTTQTADWFENLGFTLTPVETLPEARKAAWTPERGSKALRLVLK